MSSSIAVGAPMAFPMPPPAPLPSLATLPAPAAPPDAAGTRPLRIVMVAPPWFELPPRGYGGTEAVVAALVDGLVDRGHEVTLIGSGRHRTRAQRFHAVFAEPPMHRLGAAAPEVMAAAVAAEVIDGLDIDVVHDHTLAGPLLARGRAVPTVITMHGPATGEGGDYVRRLGDSVDVVAISEAQRRSNPSLHWVGVVHNGVDVASFRTAAKDDYVLWLGRFSADKGPHLAIEAARRAGMPIVLAGKRNEPEEKAFFEAEVAPRLGVGTRFVGEADTALKRELLARARVLAFPIQWEEPFGMVMVEAMASGTPVVALRRGSVDEVLVDGVTGIVVDQPGDLPRALTEAAALPGARCRAHVWTHFDQAVMAAAYERVYRAAISARPLDRLAPAQVLA